MLEWDGDPSSDTTYVLVHGFLDLAYGWRGVAERLAAHKLHVIAPDVRGHGDSDWVGSGGYYHFLDYIADLDEVINRLARTRVVVVGHSMGGGIVSYWAGTRPKRPHAIALLEGIGPPDQSEAQLPGRTVHWIDNWRAARAKAPPPLPSLADAVRRLRKYDPLLSEALAHELAVAGTRPHVDGLTWKHDPLHMTMGPYPFRLEAAIQYWKAITCPVLIVDAAQTIMSLPDPERAARRSHFANHRHVTIEGAGHMMQRHQPEQIAELLRRL